MAKHKQTKEKEISPEVKEAVFARDGGCCVWCGRSGAYVLPEAHFIARSKMGKGIEQNILTLCRPCHDRYDNGPRRDRENMRNYFREYLSERYPDWNEQDLIYRRFPDEH